jgi:hypothetical protein
MRQRLIEYHLCYERIMSRMWVSGAHSCPKLGIRPWFESLEDVPGMGMDCTFRLAIIPSVA